MSAALANLNGGFGDAVLVLYLIGGVMLAVSAAFPGQSSAQRAGRVVIGVVVVGWAGYVLLFGGWIIISWYVAVLPFILAVQGIVAAVRSKRSPSSSPPPLAPGQPSPYPQFPPAGAAYPAAQPGPYQAAQPGPYQAAQAAPAYGQVVPPQPTPATYRPFNQPAYPAPGQAPVQGGYPAPGQLPAPAGYPVPGQGGYPVPPQQPYPGRANRPMGRRHSTRCSQGSSRIRRPDTRRSVGALGQYLVTHGDCLLRGQRDGGGVVAQPGA